MNVDDFEDDDVYIGQLQDVFDSCDTHKNGYLRRSELLTLCHKLQLDNQARSLVDKLLQNVGKDKVFLIWHFQLDF